MLGRSSHAACAPVAAAAAFAAMHGETRRHHRASASHTLTYVGDGGRGGTYDQPPPPCYWNAARTALCSAPYSSRVAPTTHARPLSCTLPLCAFHCGHLPCHCPIPSLATRVCVALSPPEQHAKVPKGAIIANLDKQAPNNSYDCKAYYEDHEFRCEGCGQRFTWTAKEQQRWYESVKGVIYTQIKYCKDCYLKHKSDKKPVQ